MRFLHIYFTFTPNNTFLWKITLPDIASKSLDKLNDEHTVAGCYSNSLRRLDRERTHVLPHRRANAHEDFAVRCEYAHLHELHRIKNIMNGHLIIHLLL